MSATQQLEYWQRKLIELQQPSIPTQQEQRQEKRKIKSPTPKRQQQQRTYDGISQMSTTQILEHWQQIPLVLADSLSPTEEISQISATQASETQIQKTTHQEIQKPENWESLSKRQKCNWKRNHKYNCTGRRVCSLRDLSRKIRSP